MGIVVPALVGLVTACGGSKSREEEPMMPASAAQSAPAAAEEQNGQEPQQCQSNEDCGKGYTCGFDPSRSYVTKYCL
jgi:hypothetical protein